MAQQIAYQSHTLKYEGRILSLRPTLRCAITLEAMHGDFDKLIEKLTAFDTQTVKAMITHAATSDPNPFLCHIENAPLGQLRANILPLLFQVVAGFFPDDPEPRPTAAKPQRSLPWSKVFSELYGYGTGWLGWTPEQSFNATPAELIAAFNAHVTKLKAIHGGEDDTKEPDPEQREQNVKDGLDPDLDRAGLRYLKRMQQGA